MTPPISKLRIASDGGSENGPYTPASSEYRLAPESDDSVFPGAATEIWAQTTHPAQLKSKLPLIVFLHGNYATCGEGSNPRKAASCEYTHTGKCPEGQTVIPSHLGFQYLAERLASRGYLVVSINANLGINCNTALETKVEHSRARTKDPGLVIARANLVLKHLALLKTWNETGGAPSDFDFKGRIDFDRVGFLGHSRGGEAMRAAYNIHKNHIKNRTMTDLPPMNVRGIFEIAPTDRSVPRFDALDTAWNVLLPMCDGDVFSLEGRRPLDRMFATESESNPTPKSMLVAWGANHAYYNTEWQTSDSKGCAGPNRKPIWNGFMGSEAIQKTATVSAVSFFRVHVGGEKRYAELFDPLFALPDSLKDLTVFNRAYLKSPALVKKFIATDVNTVSVPERDSSLKALHFEWSSGKESKVFEIEWVAPAFENFSDYESFDFRVSRALSPLNSAEPTLFDIQFVYEGGVLGELLPISDYTTLLGPAGSFGEKPGTENLHSIFQSVRIPLKDLNRGTHLNLGVQGVRFTFPKQTKGSLYFSDFLVSLKN